MKHKQVRSIYTDVYLRKHVFVHTALELRILESKETHYD